MSTQPVVVIGAWPGSSCCFEQGVGHCSAAAKGPFDPRAPAPIPASPEVEVSVEQESL